MSGDFDFPIPVGNPTYTVGDVSKSVPAFMLAYLPFPSMGVTVATLDKDGNLTIKVDQPPEHTAVAAIKFAMEANEGFAFLNAWLHGDWDTIKIDWPEAPEVLKR